MGEEVVSALGLSVFIVLVADVATSGRDMQPAVEAAPGQPDNGEPAVGGLMVGFEQTD
jgi:hypothetical protein